MHNATMLSSGAGFRSQSGTLARPDRRLISLLALSLGVLLMASGASADAKPRKARKSSAARLGDAQRAFVEARYKDALSDVRKVDLRAIVNDDYALYIRAQSEFLTGAPKAAMASFRRLAKLRGSRFAKEIPWRVADCRWELGQRQRARKDYERLLRKGAGRAEAAVARYRIARADYARGKKSLAGRRLRSLLIDYPTHPLGRQIERDLRAWGHDPLRFSGQERIKRARTMTKAHAWHESIEELRRIGDGKDAQAQGGQKMTPALARKRDYWTGMTLFKMRRRYGDAGELLTGLYKEMGSDAAKALFHGARGLSRANRDKQAITWYLRVVASYPHSRWAAEAQFLAGWLEFNLGNYADGIAHLARTRKRYKSSRWAKEALWFEGYSHYLLGDFERALPLFEVMAKKSGRLHGGKGHYWKARALERLGRNQQAHASYRALVGRFPFAWYALLARARLQSAGETIDIFGDHPSSSSAGTQIALTIDSAVSRKIAADPLLRTADELIAARLDVEAGYELRRGEKAFLKRHKKRKAQALAVLLDSYRRANDFNRPWYLGIVYGRKALRAPPRGQARVWWQHAYPKAFDTLIEKHRALGGSPPYYLFSIMRKESGFNRHVLSYADAYGLLQMIPATTQRVAAALKMDYTTDLLWDPELNIKTGSWYIGRLLSKFRGQIPIGAGSYNSGPRPWMRWIDKNGERPIDEFIELVSYRQTREYAKKVTETYARYRYLYDGEVYEQSLEVNKAYVVDELTY